MYKVIGTTRSRALRIMWMLNEIGEPYEQIKVAPGSDDAKKISPRGKLPALIQDGEILTDSVAIMTYLADKHGKLTAPAGTVSRARQDAMTLWIIDEMDSVLMSEAKYADILQQNNQGSALQYAFKHEFARAADMLSNRLKGEFLMGDELTLPDILAGHCLIWAVSAKFPRTNSKLFMYGKRLRQRSAFKAALLA